MAVFENSTASIEDTFEVLSTSEIIGLGKNDDGVPYEIQIIAYKKTIFLLCEMLENNVFKSDLATLCKLHKEAAAEIDIRHPGEAGIIRTRKVYLSGVDYMPPAPDELKKILDCAFAEINKIEDPVDKAITLFMAISKIQPFTDVNKRTTLLMMNGILVENGYHPVFVPKKYKNDFRRALTDLYDMRDKKRMTVFFEMIAQKIMNRQIDRLIFKP